MTAPILALIFFVFVGIVILIVSANQSTPVAATEPSASPATPVSTPTPSDWTLGHSTNPVTGVVTTVASTSGDHNILVRLIGKKLDCYINTPDFLETVDTIEGGSSMVQYKFDDGKVIRQGWGLGEDNTSLFGESHCTSLVALLRKSKKLAFEYKPADKVATTYIFDVDGFPAEFMAGGPH
jgi:hypothetical protein